MKYDNTQALACIDNRISETKTAWQNRRDLLNEIYSLYRFWTSAESDVKLGERSNIFIPIAFSIVETKLPRLVQALLSLDPFFKVEGRTQRDHPNAEFMTNLLQYQLNDELNAFYLLTMWFKEALLYGNSYMFVGWEKEQADIKKRVPIMYGPEVIGYDYKMINETIYDGQSLQHLDIFDCYPAPFGNRINGRQHERMPYFIVRAEPTAQYLKALSQSNDQSGTSVLDSKAVEDVLKRFPHGYGDPEENRNERMNYNNLSQVSPDPDAPRYVMWTMFENDWWVSKIGDTVVRNKENPFGDNKIPIVSAMDTPVPHEHTAIGQIEPIIKLQYYANDLENLKLDFLMKSINPGSLISHESFLDSQAYMNDPDGIHVVKGNPLLARVVNQSPNSNLINGTQEQINLERLIDKTLGQNDISRGQGKAGADTATEVVSLIEQANFRFDLSVRLLKNESLLPLLDMMAERNIMFFPYEKEIRVYDDNGEAEFMSIPVSALIGNYRFKMKSNPAQGNKMAYAQTLIRFLDVINASGGQNPNMTREIAKYLEIENLDELLDNPVEDAVGMVVQASQEGLLANSQQAALVLSKVLEILAPPGSRIAQKIGKMQAPGRTGGAMRGPIPMAQDNRGVVRQMAGQMEAQ